MAIIYIVEDDPNIQEIEAFALKNAGLDVQTFSSAAAFTQELRKKQPDLILLDIMLPDQDGLQVLTSLRSSSQTEKIPVIMVTAKSTEVDIVKGLDQGADDYITKPFGIMELISRVKALLRRSHPEADHESLKLDELELIPDKRLCLINGESIVLTFKEYELLEYLLRNTGIVMKRQVLLDRIWGIDFEGETRTLDAHIKTLRQKLGTAGNHIVTIRNVGYTIQ